MPEWRQCTRCTINYEINDPPKRDTEQSRCPECDLPFWHCFYQPGTGRDRGSRRAICGVRRENANLIPRQRAAARCAR